jgi:hypothetical protein
VHIPSVEKKRFASHPLRNELSLSDIYAHMSSVAEKELASQPLKSELSLSDIYAHMSSVAEKQLASQPLRSELSLSDMCTHIPSAADESTVCLLGKVAEGFVICLTFATASASDWTFFMAAICLLPLVVTTAGTASSSDELSRCSAS